jgi:hypothetical protein
MACRQRGELDPTGEEEGIGADHECIGLVADKGRERSIDRCGVTRPDDLHLHPHGGYRCRHFPRYGLGVRIIGLISRPMRVAEGVSSRRSPSCFAARSVRPARCGVEWVVVRTPNPSQGGSCGKVFEVLTVRKYV